MNQRSYIKKIIKCFNMKECKLVETPFDVNLNYFGWRICECAKRNERFSIQGRSRISHVCNGGHEGWYCICGEYCETIHIEGWSTALDGHETYHEVFEGHFGLQIMPGRQWCGLERFLRCQLGWRCKRPVIHHGVHVLCWCWSHFVKMQENNPPMHCLQRRWSTWLLAIRLRNWLAWATFSKCGICVRKTDIHHVWQSRVHSTCKESYTPFPHQTYRCTTSLHYRETRKSINIFEVLSNEGYDCGCADQTTCKG